MFFPDVPTVAVGDVPPDAVLLDCREDAEWQAGHIDGALHIPMNSVPARVAYEPGELTPERTVVVVCKMGSRSAHVAAWLNEQGYAALNLEGGMLAWAAAGRPIVSSSQVHPYVA